MYCSDGRRGGQVDEFLHEGLRLPRYDRVAIPGVPACLAGHLSTWHQEAALVEHLEFLAGVHGLSRIVLVAHDECAFHTARLGLSGADRERQQRRDLDAASQGLARLHPDIAVQTWLARCDRDPVRFAKGSTLRE